MNRTQLNAAVTLAQTNADLSAHDDSILHGFGLHAFAPVVVTIPQLARMIRWQCVQLNGGIDSDALNEIARIGRTKFTVVGEGA
jgi:hypothetical protein